MSFEVKISFAYDSDSLLIRAGDLTLTRDPQNGRLYGTTLGTITDSYDYDPLGQLSVYSASAGGTEIFRVEYTRDDLGRITTKTETRYGVTFTESYGYNLAGRLERVYRNGVLTDSWTYDVNGNRLSHTREGEAPAKPSIASANYDPQDRLLTYGGATYTYTANGELLTRTDSTGTTTTYAYDLLGNLLRVKMPDGTLIEYMIDAQNRRVGRKLDGVFERGWLYADQLNPIAELDASGNVISRFVYGSRLNVPDYIVRGGTTYRVISDHLGSVRYVVDTSTDAIVQSLDYDVWGNVLIDSNPGFQPFAFAGGLYDRTTRLTRFGARDYDADTGRFIVKDPINFAGGDTNLYAYVVNDPVNLLDPMGTDWVEAMEPIGNFAAGMGDTLSFGLTTRFNEWTGASAVIDKCSGAFSGGELFGTGVSVAFGAGHLGRNAAKQGLKRLAYDNRVWPSVRRMWSGRPPTLRSTGRSLHHWLLPQRAIKSGAPQGIVNAGFNYFPISAGLNSWMNGTTATRSAVEWGMKGTVSGIYGGLFGGSGAGGECGCS